MKSTEADFIVKADGARFYPRVIYIVHAQPFDRTVRYLGLFRRYPFKSSDLCNSDDFYVGYRCVLPLPRRSESWSFARIGRQRFSEFEQRIASCTMSFAPDEAFVCDASNYSFHLYLGQSEMSLRWAAELPQGWHALSPAIDALVALRGEFLLHC